jgi:hypothetical protein
LQHHQEISGQVISQSAPQTEKNKTMRVPAPEKKKKTTKSAKQ